VSMPDANSGDEVQVAAGKYQCASGGEGIHINKTLQIVAFMGNVIWIATARSMHPLSSEISKMLHQLQPRRGETCSSCERGRAKLVASSRHCLQRKSNLCHRFALLSSLSVLHLVV
jgi:hypothetical protein